MGSKRGLSDVVTTVVIVALSLVAITVVWIVIQNIISSNTETINLQRDCLDIQLEVNLIKGTGNQHTVTAKRTFGSVEFSGLKMILYNSSTSKENASIGNLNIGAMISRTIVIEGVSEYAVVPYFEMGGKNHTCSNIVKKKV